MKDFVKDLKPFCETESDAESEKYDNCESKTEEIATVDYLSAGRLHRCVSEDGSDLFFILHIALRQT